MSDNAFAVRPVPMPDLSDERVFPGGIKVKVLFEPDCKWRLVEEFGTGCFKEQEDGKLLFCAANVVAWKRQSAGDAPILKIRSGEAAR